MQELALNRLRRSPGERSLHFPICVHKRVPKCPAAAEGQMRHQQHSIAGAALLPQASHSFGLGLGLEAL
jgi:hypothetical protein